MQLAGIAFGIVFAALGLGLAAHLLQAARRGRQSRQWPTTAGHIVTSHTYRDGPDQDVLRATVRYAYRVGAERHEATRVCFGVRGDTHRHAAERAARYPVGRAVTVHYHPARPTLATLEPGFDSVSWRLVGAWATAALFGSVGLALLSSAS